MPPSPLACAIATAGVLALVHAHAPSAVRGGGAVAVAAEQEPESIGAVGRISQEEFKKLLKNGKVIVLDVRGPQAYRAGHIPGAISVPLEEVAAKAAQWKSASQPIVTYCS